MFNSLSQAPSIADIAAVTGRNNDGFGFGGDYWILILLFFFCGRGGWGRNEEYNIDASLQRGFDNQGVMNSLRGLEQGLCSLGYDQLSQMNGINTNILMSNNSLGRQLADCCCETREAISQVRYDIASNACAINNNIDKAARDIIDNQNANYRALHEENVQARLAAKDEKIAEQASLIQSLNLSISQGNQNQYLLNQLMPQPVPAYPACGPYSNGFFRNPFVNSNNCCTCNNCSQF